MAKRSKRKGHGTGIKDYTSYGELVELPARESLAPGKNGPTTRILTGPGISFTTTEDDRSEVERVAQAEWDARVKEIMEGRDDRLAKRKQDTLVQAKKIARGGMVWANVPADEQKETAQQPANPPEERATSVNTVIQNGTPQKKPTENPGKPTPLRPKETPRSEITTDSKWGKTGASDTGIRVNGAPVDARDTATVNNIRAQQRESTAIDAIEAAEARRDAQTRAKLGDRRRVQQETAIRDELDAVTTARRARMEAERQKKEQDRMDKRFADRKLSNQDDWKNLGRKGGNNVDYSDPKNAKAKEVHDSNVAALRDRLARLGDRTLVREGENAEWKDGKMVVTDKDGKVVDASKRTTTGVGDDGQRYANDFYAYDPGRQRSLAGLRKLVEKGFGDGTLTDAQIEGAMKTLDGWEAGAQSRKSAQEGREQMRQAERMRGLRSQYGMEDRQLYDDTAVQNYHDRVQTARRKEILGTMAANGSAAKPGDYGEAWQQLLDAGFDPKKTLANARKDQDVASKLDDAKFKIDVDSTLSKSAKAELRDQLDHQAIMTQAFKEAGIDSAQPVDIGSVRRENVGAEPSGDYATTVAQNVQTEINPAASQQPQQPSQPVLTPKKKKKKDDEFAASLGGYAMSVLRPRRRS